MDYKLKVADLGAYNGKKLCMSSFMTVTNEGCSGVRAIYIRSKDHTLSGKYDIWVRAESLEDVQKLTQTYGMDDVLIHTYYPKNVNNFKTGETCQRK